MKTRTISASEIERKWVVFDAAGQTLGRLSTHVATLLMGKNKPAFSPNIDGGDHVVVVNAEKVQVTGKKLEQKVYHRHSGYPGGLHAEALGPLLKRKPAWVVEHAIRGMLPRTRLGDAMMGKLRVYSGPAHPHDGQVNAGRAAEKRPARRPRSVSPPTATVSAEEAEPQAT